MGDRTRPELKIERMRRAAHRNGVYPVEPDQLVRAGHRRVPRGRASAPRPLHPTVPSSYLVLPPVVQDIAATLKGRLAVEIAHRRPMRNPNDYAMHRVDGTIRIAP
jgi:hypothetical protein